MYIDYCITSFDTKESFIKDDIKNLLALSVVDSITVPYFLLRTVKTLIPDNINLSCLIDYPLGISDSKTRLSACSEAIKLGAKSLDLSMPQMLVANRKYDKIREDISNIKNIQPNIDIRYILEYRHFNHNSLKKICSILESFDIKRVYPSSGFFLDNLSDNIIASVFLAKNSTKLNMILTGNAWTEEHFETIQKTGLYGFRCFSVESVKNYYHYDLKSNGV